METYTEAKVLTTNPDFTVQRNKTLSGLKQEMIEKPIREIINALNEHPCFFTLQCCYGHFLYDGQRDSESLSPLPETHSKSKVEYRIAYIAFCIENSPEGKVLLNQLEDVPTIDPSNIQFGSADWFWERQVNSYVIQVQPKRLKHLDKMDLAYEEALDIQKTRDRFYEKMEMLVNEL